MARLDNFLFITLDTFMSCSGKRLFSFLRRGNRPKNNPLLSLKNAVKVMEEICGDKFS